MKNIGIIGYGYVGKVIANLFKDHYKISVFDPPLLESMKIGDKGIRAKLEENIEIVSDEADINSCDLAIVCVPTPSKENGEVDLSYLHETFKWLNTPLILIKSTVLPGITDELIAGKGSDWIDRKIVFSPEYIGEGKYVVQWWKDRGYPHPTDMKYHDFQIFGGSREATGGVIEFFKKVLGPHVKYIQTDAKTAELTKYMENSWGATKVTFVNEFSRIADVFGVDYNELRELFLLDGRTERMHTVVFKDNPGFGGKCYPKDVKGIVKASEDAGYEPKLMKEVLSSNDKFRKK